MSESPESTPNVIIKAKGLVKTFGNFRALDGLDLEVRKGEVHGFLGPNGAGKSTTLRVVLGMLRSSGGEVHLFGEDPWKDSVQLHKRLAYVPGDVDLWPTLSGGEAIDLLGKLRGGIDKKRRAKLIDAFQLNPAKKCRTYSKGNRQKVAIIAALASDVDLYLMDEPTSGLDPLMQSIFNREIIKLKEAGKTVVLSSHVLSEVETLCDQVTIIKEGKTVETGRLDDLRGVMSMTVVARTKKPVTGLETLKGVSDVQVTGHEVSLSVSQGNLNELLTQLAKFNVEYMNCSHPTLEELFLRHYNTEGK